MTSSAITILSGGLDSSTATLLARKNYQISLALTFDYGQRAAAKEMEAAQKFCKQWNIEQKTIKLPWLADITHTALVNRDVSLPSMTTEELGKNPEYEHHTAKTVWVPNRNGVFLAVAAAYAEGSKIDALIVGFNVEEAATFPDNSLAFMNISNESLSFSTQNQVRVMSPTINMTKIDILRIAIEHDLDLHALWSCYEGGAKQCGKCESCARTIRAMQTLGVWKEYETIFS